MGVKFSWATTTHENLSPRKFNPRNIVPTKICAPTVCIYIFFIYTCMSTMFNTQKSPAECILLVPHWVKMPPVWLAKFSKLYRQSNSYFSIRTTWAPGPGILYYGTQCTVLQCWKLVPCIHWVITCFGFSTWYMWHALGIMLVQWIHRAMVNVQRSPDCQEWPSRWANLENKVSYQKIIISK